MDFLTLKVRSIAAILRIAASLSLGYLSFAVNAAHGYH